MNSIKYFLFFVVIFVISASIFGCNAGKIVERGVVKEVTKVAGEVSQGKKGPHVVTPTGTERFFENFESYGVGQVAPFGPWKAKGSRAHIEEAVQPNGKIGKILHVEEPDFIYLDKDWGNYILELNWKDGEPGIYFRISSDGNKGYYITKGLGYMSRVRLYKFVGSSSQKIAEGKGSNAGQEWSYWRVEVIGGNIKVYLNGEKMIDIVDNDESLSKGGIGIGSRYGGVNYDNIRVKLLK